MRDPAALDMVDIKIGSPSLLGVFQSAWIEKATYFQVQDEPMSLDSYQEFTGTTITSSSRNVPYLIMGLVSEVGEVLQSVEFKDTLLRHHSTETMVKCLTLGEVKKEIRDDYKMPPGVQFDLKPLTSELGDVLWYVSRLASQLGYTLEEIKMDKGKNDCLKFIDVLVDGPFIKELYSPLLKFRGSRNQRIIKIK